MCRKHLITTCRPTFTVILKKCDVFWCLLAVCVEKACCYRRFTTRMRLFPRIFKQLPIDYRAKNGIYSHIHRCALFSSIKKKQTNKQTKIATPFHQSMPVCIKQIMVCKPLSAVVCCFKVSFTIKWKKNCKTFLFQLKKKEKTATLFHSSALRVFVLSEDNASVL